MWHFWATEPNVERDHIVQTQAEEGVCATFACQNHLGDMARMPNYWMLCDIAVVYEDYVARIFTSGTGLENLEHMCPRRRK